MNKRNIVLIGFMGCGKTNIGRRLSCKLDYKFIDTDEYIEQSENMKITEIFEQKGEEYFRGLEAELVERLSESCGSIIATGGGIIKSSKNVENLKKSGVIVYLKATPEHIYNNLANDNTRPLLQGGDKMDKITTLMEQRRAMYEGCADITVDVTKDTALIVMERIIKEVRDFEKNMRHSWPQS